MHKPMRAKHPPVGVDRGLIQSSLSPANKLCSVPHIRLDKSLMARECPRSLPLGYSRWHHDYSNSGGEAGEKANS